MDQDQQQVAIAVRPLESDDIPAISAWLSALPLYQRYALTEARARILLQSALERHDLLLVADAAQAEGRACGLAWCLPGGAFGRSAYLRILGVRADHAGHGVGAVLLRAAEVAVAPPANALFLLVSDFNSGAQRFYQRQGYAQVGAIPGYVLPDVTELLYWKRLPSSA